MSFNHWMYTKYLNSLDGLIISNSLLEKPISERMYEVSRFINENVELKKVVENNVEKTFILIKNHRRRQDVKEKIAERSQLERVKRILPRNTLISMVSEFDYFVSELLNNIYNYNPVYIKSSKREFSFQEIMNYNNIEEIKKYTIEKEIESVLRCSHSEQFSFLEKKFSISTLKKFQSWKYFIEITERRNLFVHTDGKVSNQYIAVCKRECHQTDVCEGEYLHVDDEYLVNAHRIIYEIIFKLNHIILGVVFKDDIDLMGKINTVAINVIFNLLCKENYVLVDLLCEFLLSKDSLIVAEKYKRMIVINYCLSLKYQGKDKFKNEINKLDWSSCNDVFTLAKSCIDDDNEKSCKIIEKIISAGANELSRSSLHDWPLFKKLRGEKIFLDLYEKLYHDSFDDINFIENESLISEEE